MKITKYSIAILFSGVLLMQLLACTDNFSSLNSDPSLVSKDVINPDMLFTQSLRSGMFNLVSTGGRLKAYAGIQSSSGEGPIFTQGNHNNPFNTYYRNYLMPVAEAIRLMEGDPEKVNKVAKARIWRAFLFSQLTDYYGDIPYTEAVRDLSEGVIQPVYDTQEFIYRDLLNELRQAVNDLQVTSTQENYGSADIIYGGDVIMWQRFGNSLRLRLALRVHFTDRNLATEHISEVINQPLIESNNENANITTEPANATQTQNRNPLYERVFESPVGAGRIWCTFNVTDILDSRNDPRLPYYCEPIETDGVSFRGHINNLAPGQGEGAYASENISRVGFYFSQSVYTINAMTASEVAFNKAEAYLYELVPGDTQTAYTEGIRLSMSTFDIAEEEIAEYIIGPEGSLSGNQEEMHEKIGTQKWIALYQDYIEAWTEVRRTGYPALLFGTFPGVTNDRSPRRLTYGESEYNHNISNVSEAANRLELGDDYMSRIWWDAKPGVLDIRHPFQDEPNETWPPN